MSREKVALLQAGRKAKRESFRVVRLPRATITAYDHGWRLEHKTRSEPTYYTDLAGALVAYLDREAGWEGKEILATLREIEQVIRSLDCVRRA